MIKCFVFAISAVLIIFIPLEIFLKSSFLFQDKKVNKLNHPNKMSVETERKINLAQDLEVSLYSLGFKVYNKLQPATNFTLTDLNGKKVSLKDYYGKFVLINFWATWCAPCIQEIPILQKLHNTMKNRNLVVLTINTSRESALEVITQNNATYPVLIDSNSKITTAYNIHYYPTAYLIDQKGNLMAMIKGNQGWNQSHFQDLYKLLLQ